MFKRLLILSLILLITAAAIIKIVNFYKPVPAGTESAQPVNTTLKVSSEGSQMTTDISGGDLQQAAQPASSAAGANSDPQASQPNYCAPGEVPFADGCVPSQ